LFWQYTLKGGRVILPRAELGPTLPPSRRAVQALVEWLFAVIKALSVLGLLHCGLLVASQSHREILSKDPKDPIEAALAEGRSLRKAGKLAEALRQFNRALALARESKSTEQTVRSLMLIATVQLLSFQYKSATASSTDAFVLAEQGGYYALAGGASGTICSIYMQLGDFQRAEVEAVRAIALLRRAPQTDPQTAGFLVRALQMQAALFVLQGRTIEGKKSYDEAVILAQHAGDKALEALVWDSRGIALLRGNDLAAAESSLRKSFELRQGLHDSENLPISKEHLAELELKRPQPNYTAALKLIDEAFSSDSTVFKTSPQYYPIHIRAEILLRLGEKVKALDEFRHAVEAAQAWREGALPGDITNTQTVIELHEVYRDFAHLAAAISLENNNRALRDEGLEVLTLNRAASLREQVRLALATDAKLPDSYFQKLSALAAAQARVTLGKDSKADRIELARIRIEIGDLENQIDPVIGKTSFYKERNSRRNSLRDIQSRLGGGQVLLSFSLGETRSYLWAVTSDHIYLDEIDGRARLEGLATQLAKAAHEGTDIKGSGRQLSSALFGKLPAAVATKPEWLIVADGALLNGVPFATLPNLCATPGAGLLLEEHSLRLTPSELLLLSPRLRENAAARFVGVADPIYNHADTRLSRKQAVDGAQMEASSVTLARLAGSSLEVRRSAQECGLRTQQILTGPQASLEELRRSLTDPPQLLHFAVHVVSPPDRSQEAALALSLKEGVPELLTPEAIATFRLPGSLVVMSGCSSGLGKPVPSAGLLGLSRAWLLAGAAAVVASAWPTPDDSGRFFSSFYSHLQAAKTGSMGQRAAYALGQAQLEMRRGGGYTSSPSYWAAYSIVSRE
jgi:CHAT domain-containing protein/tetratricopeptide (TPR) repeat protein